MTFANQKLPIAWLKLINSSFLSLYLAKPMADDEVYITGYDNVFEFENAIIYVLVDTQTVALTSDSIARSRVETLKQKSASTLLKRHQKLLAKADKNLQHKKTPLLSKNVALSNGMLLGAKNSPINTIANATVNAEQRYVKQLESGETVYLKPVYYIGLTNIQGEQPHTGDKQSSLELQTYAIQHDYSSQFFSEECVLDLDDASQVLQIFSLPSFIQMLNALQTPSDLLDFLIFHRHVIVVPTGNTPPVYQGQLQLLTHFLNSPHFFARAFRVQQQLVDIGLLDSIEPRLLAFTQPTQLSSDAANQKVQAQRQQLNASLYKSTAMWYQLVNGLTKRLHQQGKLLPVWQTRKLVGESKYTCNSIVEEVMAYGKVSADERKQGYVRHQHAYNRFGRHYMLVFYAQDSNSPLSQAAIKQTHQELLFELNTHLQNPPMDDLILLGFAFKRPQINNQKTEGDVTEGDVTEGDVEVQMDAYYQAGAKLTAGVQQLYQQLEALKTNTSSK